MVFFGIEAGGTKWNCVVGVGTDIIEQRRVPTTTPDDTIPACRAFFDEAVARHGGPTGFGIATFGPVDLATGVIGATPKPGWEGADLRRAFSSYGCPVGIETDVTGAAIGEAAHGAGIGLSHVVYLTVGTGIGGGAIADGRPLRGRPHPEMGHVLVRRDPSDRFEGTCPHHRDCLEGLACGPAISARWERSSHDLGPHLEAAVALEADYLAQGIASIVAVLAPERVIVGGGVMAMPGMLEATRSRFAELAAGYPDPAVQRDLDAFLSPPGLGDLAGSVGALEVARLAAGSR